MTSATLRFPRNRIAEFTTSFGAADSAVFTVVGTKGVLKLCQAYEYSEKMEMEIIVDGKSERREYALRDQFASELLYFSECILRNREPEPSGVEGLVDVHIIRSLYESARLHIPVALKRLTRRRRPTLRQEVYRRPSEAPPKVHAESPTR